MSSNENLEQCAGIEHALNKPDFESKRQKFPKLDEPQTAYKVSGKWNLTS